MKNNIRQRICQIIIKSLRLKKLPEEIDGVNLITELGITSIDSLEILIGIEIEFGIRVEDEDLNQQLVSSLNNLEEYILARIS